MTQTWVCPGDGLGLKDFKTHRQKVRVERVAGNLEPRTWRMFYLPK
jgi:hypothetical protein